MKRKKIDENIWDRVLKTGRLLLHAYKMHTFVVKG